MQTIDNYKDILLYNHINMDKERPELNNKIMDNFMTQTAGIDLSQIPPINQKRMLTFINNFIITNVSFLNRFAATCEHKLIMNHQKILKIEAELRIIEAKVNSIPGLGEAENKTVAQANVSSPATNVNLPEPTNPTTVPIAEEMPELPTPEVESEPAQAKRNPELDKFFKMLQFGVPPPAVKQKMVQEGFDPNLLDA